MRYARIGCISGDWLRLEGGAPLQTMRLPRPTAATREAPPGMMVRARGGSEQGRVGALGSGNWVCRWGSWCAARHGRCSSGPSRRRWARDWNPSIGCSCSTGAVPWCATATCESGDSHRDWSRSVQVPKVRGHSAGGIKFDALLAPTSVRRRPRVSAALPWLYSRGSPVGTFTRRRGHWSGMILEDLAWRRHRRGEPRRGVVAETD